MGMLPPGFKNEVKQKFAEIFNEVSQSIIIYTEPQKADCPNCLSDPTGASVGVFDDTFIAPVEIFGQTITPQSFSRIRCPVCHGVGHLEYESSTSIKAIVRWNPPSEMSNGELSSTPGGMEGRNVVRVKTQKCYYDILRDAKKAVIDGVECEVYLPPVIRHVGEVDVMATAYFVSVASGYNVRGD